MPPFVGRAFLDGQQTPFRQVEYAALVQWIGPDQDLHTAYVWPGDPWPIAAVDVTVPPPTAATLADGRSTQHPRLRVGLGIASGVALACSATLYGLAAQSASAYEHGDIPYSEGTTTLRRTNSMAISSGGLAVVGAGLGIGAAWSGRW